MQLASNKHGIPWIISKAKRLEKHLYDEQHRQAEVSNMVRNIMQKELSNCNLPIFFTWKFSIAQEGDKIHQRGRYASTKIIVATAPSWYDEQNRQAEVSNTIRYIMQKELSKCNLPIFFNWKFSIAQLLECSIHYYWSFQVELVFRLPVPHKYFLFRHDELATTHCCPHNNHPTSWFVMTNWQPLTVAAQ